MAKKCPPGKYYCFTDKKCKKIPRGYRIGARGYLARGDNRSDSDGDDGSGNGSSNGNGNGGNGAGNGNGGSGGNGGGNGGGGMGESIIYEKSNPRIPRKAGQPAKSKKHSDLYTDEDPKGTIHGLGFKDVAKARASVSKIRNSSRSHAHKIQAAVAMEQRAREMGKTSEAAVYRKYINSMKKKTKRMNEAVSAAQQAAIAIDMKKKGKKPKSIKEGMYNHTDVGLITNAVVELEDGLKTLKSITYDSVDQLMQGIAKRNDISPTLLHNQFKAKHLTIPDDWAIRYRMNKMKGIEEAKMTPAQKRKDTRLKKKYDKSDMKKSMQKQYGKEEGKKIYFATIRKQAMGEESQESMLARVRAAQDKIQDKVETKDKMKKANKPFIEPKKGEVIDDDYKYNVSEEGLRDWFGKSSGTTKSGRKVRGWVQVGGKYDGKPCARQPGQKSTPKCVSSSKRRSMSDKERDSAARRKRAADPNQPQKSGAAKPTNVSTDPKRKMKENYFSRKKVVDEAAITAGALGTAALLGATGGTASAIAQNMTNKVMKKKKKSLKEFKIGGKPLFGKKGEAIFYNDPKGRREALKTKQSETGGGDYTIKKLSPKVNLGLEKNVDITKDSPTKVGGQVVKDKVIKPATRYVQNQASNIRQQVSQGIRDGVKGVGSDIKKGAIGAVKGVGKSIMKNPGKAALIGGAVVGTAALAKKTLGGKKKMKEETQLNEVKDKKGKGSGTKDACYHKVKSRYSVWPSAYASGALVKCRKVGAANWGNKTKKEGFSPMQVAALEAAGMIELNEAGKKCWKGYKKAGTQKLFGKTYNRCVKAGDELNHDGQQINEIQDPSDTFNLKGKRPEPKQVQGKREGVLPPEESKIKNKKALPPSDKSTKKPELPKLESYAPVTEGVAFLKRKKEEKKKSSSKYLTQRDAGKVAKRVMAKKDQEKVNFLEPEETNESKTRLVKNGHTYKVVLTWRGKTYMVQMFVPSVSRPTRQQVEKEVQKIYPDAKLMSFLPRDLEPGEPTVMMGEGKNLEFMKQYKQKEKEQKMKKEVKKNLGTYEGDEQHNTRMGEAIEPEGIKLRDVERIKRQKQLSDAAKKAPEVKNKIVPIKTEEVIHEDDMKGMSVKSGHKRPTKSGAGMTKKGVEAYRRRNPGSKLKTAVTTKPSKLKKGSKAANRRKSYCARSAGQMKKFPKAAKDPNSRLRQARRRWNC